VADVDAEYERLVRIAGLAPARDIRTEDRGQRHFIVADPNGVLVDVIMPTAPSPEFAAQHIQDGVRPRPHARARRPSFYDRSMCASYGLGGDPYGRDLPLDISPLDERGNPGRLAEWARENNHNARITGSTARNLNPIITAPAGRRELHFGWWWLHVGGVPAPYSAFNSRDDRLLSNWRAPFQRRGLLPATWYVEKGRTFGLPDSELFAMAAITTTVADDDGNDLVTYSMVTADAVGEARSVHPRMPLLVPRELHDEWLDPYRPGDEDLVSQVLAASDDLSHAAHIAAGPPGDPQTTLF